MLNGVSTRKVDRLVEQMGLRGLCTRTRCLRMCRGLDEQLSAFPGAWRAPLTYLWLDAKIEQAREPGGVRHNRLCGLCGPLDG